MARHLHFLKDCPPYVSGERGGGKLPRQEQEKLVASGFAEWEGELEPGELKEGDPRDFAPVDPRKQANQDKGGGAAELADALESGFPSRAADGVTVGKRGHRGHGGR